MSINLILTILYLKILDVTRDNFFLKNVNSRNKLILIPNGLKSMREITIEKQVVIVILKSDYYEEGYNL